MHEGLQKIAISSRYQDYFYAFGGNDLRPMRPTSTAIDCGQFEEDQKIDLRISAHGAPLLSVCEVPNTRRNPQSWSRIRIRNALSARHTGSVAVWRSASERERPTSRNHPRFCGLRFTGRNVNAERLSERCVVRNARRLQMLVPAMCEKTLTPCLSHGAQRGYDWPSKAGGSLRGMARRRSVLTGLVETWRGVRVP
jgi:hypothetical protein